ncbi:MAG: MarR family transcriptional regulator [Pseudomonadota bacterium]
MNSRSNEALVAIRRIQRRIEIDTRKLAQAVGITPSQLRVLQILDERGETSTGDIVKATHLSNATITSLVDKMAKRELVSRRRCHDDRRRVWLTIQSAGRESLANAPHFLQDTFEDRFDLLPDWEQAMIVSALERVASLLDAETLDAAPILAAGAVDQKPATVPPSD